MGENSGRGVLALIALSLSVAVGCGSGSSSVINVEDDDPVMLKAIDTARSTVDQFISALRSPSPDRQGLAIKALFEEGDEGEHIWLNSVEYANGSFTAQINNDPVAISTVKLGDTVTVPKSEISDWMYIKDGKLVGGYTIRALVELTPPDQLPPFPFVIE